MALKWKQKELMHKAVHAKNIYTPKAVFKQRRGIPLTSFIFMSFQSHRITAGGHLSAQDLGPLTWLLVISSFQDFKWPPCWVKTYNVTSEAHVYMSLYNLTRFALEQSLFCSKADSWPPPVGVYEAPVCSNKILKITSRRTAYLGGSLSTKFGPAVL